MSHPSTTPAAPLGAAAPVQLGLFEDAPRHYHDAMARLGRLDLAGCRDALAAHCRDFPFGPDPAPVAEAAAWLAARLPSGSVTPEDFGTAALGLCRELREGGAAPAVLASGGQVARTAVAALARAALGRARDAGIPPATPLTQGLPWGVFHLLAGDPARARQSLLAFLRTAGPTAAACLALGEACGCAGHPGEAERAWRDGYGLDPAGRAWGPEPAWLAALRGEFAADDLFAGEWWAVGAYLDGRLPRYQRTGPDRVARRLRRFHEGAQARQGRGQDPCLFFAGLFLSEHGPTLPLADLAQVRRTLRELHPEAFVLHMEFLAEHGPPPVPPARRDDGW